MCRLAACCTSRLVVLKNNGQNAVASIVMELIPTLRDKRRDPVQHHSIAALFMSLSRSNSMLSLRVYAAAAAAVIFLQSLGNVNV